MLTVMSELNSVGSLDLSKVEHHMTLPQELFEHVIDCLRYNRRELQCCALTCKAWLPRCSYHLFRLCRLGWPRKLESQGGYRGPTEFWHFLETDVRVHPFIVEVSTPLEDDLGRVIEALPYLRDRKSVV